MMTTDPKRKVRPVPFSKAYDLVDDWIKTFGDQYDNDFESKDQAVVQMVSMYAGDFFNSSETVYILGTIRNDEGYDRPVMFSLDGMDGVVHAYDFPLLFEPSELKGRYVSADDLKNKCKFLPLNCGPGDWFYEESV